MTFGLGKIDRILVATYLLAIFLLLLLPISGPEFAFLGIDSDKWVHAALFGGFSMLVRWSLSRSRRATLASIGITVILAALMEAAQGVTDYRDADLLDIFAGLVGAVFGSLLMVRVLASAAPERWIGLLVTLLGLMISLLSLLADFIGLGSSQSFGPDQLIGTVLGGFVMLGGATIVFRGLPRIP